MRRISLHRPRRPRAVWDRPAPGTRLLPNPHSPTVSQLNPHYTRCPKAERLRLRSDQSSFRPVPVTGYGRFPDKNWLALSKGPCQVRAPLTRRIILAPSGDAHEHGVMLLNQGHCAQRLPRRSLRRGHATQRRQRVHAPISPNGRALLVVETAPHRDFLASPPHPLRSSGLSQSRRRCGTSAVADHTHRCRRRRLTAQPSGTFHPLPLPFSPSFLRRQIADAPRRESIPGRAGAPLLGAYPPLLQ